MVLDSIHTIRHRPSFHRCHSILAYYFICIFHLLLSQFPQYLGFIPGVTDWQSPDSRSDFLEMVDDGQVSVICMLVHSIYYRICIHALGRSKVIQIGPASFYGLPSVIIIANDLSAS